MPVTSPARTLLDLAGTRISDDRLRRAVREALALKRVWPAQRLVVEADGAAWHDNPLARADDAERQKLLEAHGERVVRVTWTQVISRPLQTLARIRAAGAPVVHPAST